MLTKLVKKDHFSTTRGDVNQHNFSESHLAIYINCLKQSIPFYSFLRNLPYGNNHRFTKERCGKGYYS